MSYFHVTWHWILIFQNALQAEPVFGWQCEGLRLLRAPGLQWIWCGDVPRVSSRSYRTFTNSTRNNQTSQKLKNSNTFSGRIIIYFSKTVTGYMVWEQLPGFRPDERAVAGPAHHTATDFDIGIVLNDRAHGGNCRKWGRGPEYLNIFRIKTLHHLV